MELSTVLMNFDEKKDKETNDLLVGENWATFVKGIREGAGLKEIYFASMLGISVSKLVEYEKGKDFPKFIEFECAEESTILTDFDDIKNEDERELAIRTTFSEYVMDMRKAAQLTKVRFAELVGISLNSVKQYEKGIAFPRDVEEIEVRIRRVVKYEIMKRREIQHRNQIVKQIKENPTLSPLIIQMKNKLQDKMMEQGQLNRKVG